MAKLSEGKPGGKVKISSYLKSPFWRSHLPCLELWQGNTISFWKTNWVQPVKIWWELNYAEKNGGPYNLHSIWSLLWKFHKRCQQRTRVFIAINFIAIITWDHSLKNMPVNNHNASLAGQSLHMPFMFALWQDTAAATEQRGVQGKGVVLSNCSLTANVK